jgi:hypothetical protein
MIYSMYTVPMPKEEGDRVDKMELPGYISCVISTKGDYHVLQVPVAKGRGIWN